MDNATALAVGWHPKQPAAIVIEMAVALLPLPFEMAVAFEPELHSTQAADPLAEAAVAWPPLRPMAEELLSASQATQSTVALALTATGSTGCCCCWGGAP